MPIRLLIVEDEFIIAENLRAILERLGYRVVDHVDNRGDLINTLERDQVDLALLDINLNGPDSGIDLGRLLQEQYRLPFIFISSYTDDATLAQVNTVRPYGYVVKPFTEKEIKVALQLAVSKIELEALSRKSREKQWLLDIAHGIAAVRFVADLPELVCQPLREGLRFDAIDVLRAQGRDAFQSIFFDCVALKPTEIRAQLHRLYTIERTDLGVSPQRLTSPKSIIPQQPGELAAKMRELTYRHGIVIPLRSGQQLTGLLVLYSRTAPFDAALDNLYTGAGDLLAIALQNIIANEQLLLRERRKEMGIRLSEVLMKSDSWSLKMTGLKRLAQQFPVFDLVYLHHVPGAFNLSHRVFYQAGRGEYQAFAEDQLPGLLHLTKARFAELENRVGTPVEACLLHFNNAEEEPNIRSLPARLAQQLRLRQVLSLPLPLRQHPHFGVLLGSRRETAFNEEALADFTTMARSVAAALDTQLAYTEVERLSAQLEQENQYLQEAISGHYAPGFIIGDSLPMQLAMEQVRQVAPTDTTVLVTGETGTGKELVARAIHEQSRRAKRTLIKVNCAAFPASLIESELFGHEKGAFTGATGRREGKFELADGGTIFLDEVGELSLESQAKLLRVLQEKEFERVGGNQTVRLDTRVIAATNRDLQTAVDEGRFRIDLFYRLHIFPVHLPALRDREGDVELLADYFVRKYAKKLGKTIAGIGGRALRVLREYSFPGNVRELEHLIERAVITCAGKRLAVEDFASLLNTSKPAKRAAPFVARTLAERERDQILSTLKHTNGRIRGVRGAAELLDIKPTTLEARMKKLGIKKGFA